MTQTMTQTTTAGDVLAWLAENPDFLTRHPEACGLLHPPAPARICAKDGANVSDFQSYMIARLRGEKEAVLETTREIVETSRANMNIQSRIHGAVLLLLESRSFEDFIHTITMDMTALLDVDIAALVVESDGQDIPHIHQAGIRIVPAGTIGRWMGSKSVFLQSNIAGIETIFGGGASLVSSQALLRLDIAHGMSPAILALGSRDPALFCEGQATDQAAFLAGVVERCFRAWLDIP